MQQLWSIHQLYGPVGRSGNSCAVLRCVAVTSRNFVANLGSGGYIDGYRFALLVPGQGFESDRGLLLCVACQVLGKSAPSCN
jgi:hypothetical protein